ncbi:MBOAT family O-acyltransferase [Pseudaestuariivita atlantica]|uniref:Probable alginate O-acetylase AlgI n=1 Tax=Pseudaestuariivita atlantica TaxID=1317121 RepID=A0A0L1JN08_9RHOB|nr:MBOAT family protein [Pseudaestuariivita atlantica]KNG93092.1 poly(beta-D-mannuronate) O-acetylase [Pseudaestuariivita atlantica]
MVFSTPIFLFGFLPLFLVTYYLTPARHRTMTLLIASCLFYGWWKVGYLLLVLGIATLSYVAGVVAVGARTEKTRTWAVRLGIVGNLAILGWFKYAYFIAGSYSDAIARLDLGSGGGLSLPEIVLPIGLSFLVFQSISYILDVARGDAPPAARLVDFLAFSSLFPQLIAGPILRYKDLAHQFRHRTHSLALFTAGVRRFVIGLAMKILIADSVAPLADRLFALDAPTMAEGWLGAGAYAIQLFFDFAGYSAMAIGLGLMLGFRFMENFNAPYVSQSVTEFWRRWHISLSTWLRDYLYVPLGGNRGGAVRTYRNLLLTMVLGGLWHGANWTFILWGIWHGGLMAVERALGSKHRAHVWPRAIAWPLTMVFVLIGWVVFRAETVGHAFAIYAGMAGLNGVALTAEMALLTRPTEVIALTLGIALSLHPVWLGRLRAPRMETLWAASAGLRMVALFALCAVIIQARGEAPFLYFQF